MGNLKEYKKSRISFSILIILLNIIGIIWWILLPSQIVSEIIAEKLPITEQQSEQEKKANIDIKNKSLEKIRQQRSDYQLFSIFALAVFGLNGAYTYIVFSILTGRIIEIDKQESEQ